MHGLFRKSAVVMVAISIGVLSWAVIAGADAADPTSATGTIQINADGTKTLTISGTWAWPTHSGDCNQDRFGTGWAVDWNDASQPGNPIGQVNGQGPVIDVGALTATVRNPADNAVKLAPSAPYCGTYDAAKNYNSGTIFPTTHTYPATETAFNACLVTYDVHGKLADGVPPPTDGDMIAGGSGRNGDNSVEKNDGTPGGNMCLRISVATPPDLSIDKDDAGATFTAGQNGTYTVKVTHVTGTITGDITVNDTLPAGLTLVSVSGSGWTCTGAAGASSFSCVRPSAGLTGGASTPVITAVVAVSASASGSVTNTATLTNPSDTNPVNNTDSEPTPIASRPALPTPPDLTINKDDSGATFVAGGTGTYLIKVTHVAGTVTGVVTVNDTLPAGLTMVRASGTGWACDWSASSLTCTRGPEGLVNGASAPTITVVVNVGSAASGQLVNAATLTNASDTNTANNRDDEATPVVRPGAGANAGGGQVVPGSTVGVPAPRPPVGRGTLPLTGADTARTTMTGVGLLLVGLALSVRRRPRRTA